MQRSFTVAPLCNNQQSMFYQNVRPHHT